MVSYTVHISTQAQGNLLNIADYIALDNSIRAFSFIEEIQEFIVRIFPQFPRLGKLYKRQVTGAELRYIPYQDYIIIYNVNRRQQHVAVLKIFNAALDKNIILRQFDSD